MFLCREALESFSVVLGNRLKIMVKRYTRAQQLYLAEALVYILHLLEQMTWRCLVTGGKINSRLLCYRIDSGIYRIVSLTNAEMNVWEGVC